MPAERVPAAAGFRGFVKSHAPTLAAVGGYLIALAVALGSIALVNADRSASAMSHYGNTVAEDLAHQAVDPLLRRDRIQLGLLTNRVAARPEVRHIAIHTVDDRLFVAAGHPAPDSAPTYVRAVTVEDTVAGDVSVTLDAASFALPISRVLAESWQFALAGLALTVALFHFGTHLRSGAPVGDTGNTPPAARTEMFVVVAELPLLSASGTALRESQIAHASTVARRVANLYAGHAADLPGEGVVLVFPVSRSKDRCFEVVCAASLLRRLFASAHAFESTAINARNEGLGGDGFPMFRYGIDVVDTGIAIHDHAVKASVAAGVMLLASLGREGDLVLGEAAYRVLDRPDRVWLEDLENPTAGALSPDVAKPRGKIRGIADEYEALLARQTEVIVKASA